MAAWYWKLVEWLWPAQCVGCGEQGSWWCSDCDAKIVCITSPACPRCNRLTVRGEYCRTCRPRVALTGILAGAYWRTPLTEAVKALKYRHAKRIVPELVRYQLLALGRLPGLKRAVLVPIPLHPARLRKRGHNQAALLSSLLAKATEVPITAGLIRTKNTPSQTGLDRRQRQKNVEGAFVWRGRPLDGRTVLLVDDVVTTGATLNAAAIVCRAAGARQAWGLIVAKR